MFGEISHCHTWMKLHSARCTPFRALPPDLLIGIVSKQGTSKKKASVSLGCLPQKNILLGHVFDAFTPLGIFVYLGESKQIEDTLWSPEHEDEKGNAVVPCLG